MTQLKDSRKEFQPLLPAVRQETVQQIHADLKKVPWIEKIECSRLSDRELLTVFIKPVAMLHRQKGKPPVRYKLPHNVGYQKSVIRRIVTCDFRFVSQPRPMKPAYKNGYNTNQLKISLLVGEEASQGE